jgi:hypothetical protein
MLFSKPQVSCFSGVETPSFRFRIFAFFCGDSLLLLTRLARKKQVHRDWSDLSLHSMGLVACYSHGCIGIPTIVRRYYRSIIVQIAKSTLLTLVRSTWAGIVARARSTRGSDLTPQFLATTTIVLLAALYDRGRNNICGWKRTKYVGFGSQKSTLSCS